MVPAPTGSPGTVVLTFTFEVRPTPTTETNSSPKPVLLQTGLLPGSTCDAGWGASWAEWAVPVTGGNVCTQTVVYEEGQWINRDSPQIPFESPWM